MNLTIRSYINSTETTGFKNIAILFSLFIIISPPPTHASLIPTTEILLTFNLVSYTAQTKTLLNIDHQKMMSLLNFLWKILVFWKQKRSTITFIEILASYSVISFEYWCHSHFKKIFTQLPSNVNFRVRICHECWQCCTWHTLWIGFQYSVFMVRASTHGAMDRLGGPIELFLIPASAPWLV